MLNAILALSLFPKNSNLGWNMVNYCEDMHSQWVIHSATRAWKMFKNEIISNIYDAVS